MSDVSGRSVLTNEAVYAIQAALEDRQRGLRLLFRLLGIAIVVSIAFTGSINFATRIQTNVSYILLLVVVAAKLIAMLFQGLSAQLGTVSSRNFAEMFRKQIPPLEAYAAWAVSDIAAATTELTDFLVKAIGLSLLFDLPLLVGMVATVTITYSVLMFERVRKRNFLV